VRTALAGLFALLLVGCNTLPVGFGEIGDRVPPDSALTQAPDTAAGYVRYVPLGAPDKLYFGRDTAYTSRLLLRFSIPDTLDLDSVTSVELVLHTSDSAALGFVCRPCSTSWNQYGVSWQMADSFNHWYSLGGDYWPTAMGTDTTGPDSVIIGLRYVGLTDDERAAVRENGIVLFALDTGFALVQSHSSTTDGPRLQFHYSDGDQVDYLALASAIIVDTVRIEAASTDLLVGSGVGARTQLKFRFDSIPAAATITQAELTFKPRTLYRRGDTLIVGAHRLTQDFEGRGGIAQFLDAAASLRYYAPADTDSLVSFDLRTLVQFWTTWPDSNYGLVLKADPEYAEWFRLRIPRSGPGSPVLKIQYVLPPGDRFR
jgi:hypothetical protein